MNGHAPNPPSARLRVEARRSRLPFRLAGGLATLVLVLLLLLGAFPWSLAKPLVERRLSARFGMAVTIDRMERVDRFGWSPELSIRGLRIPAPDWAGGDLVRLDRADGVLPIWPLLVGRPSLRHLRLDGLAVSLVRRADGVESWRRPDAPRRGAEPPELGDVIVQNARISYRDGLHHRRLVVGLAVDPRAGLRLQGTGMVLDAPVRIAARAAPIVAGRAWPFRLAIDGPALRIVAAGTMARPLDTGEMDFALKARARDLVLFGQAIETDLFDTQAIALAARVRHDPGRWTIRDLRGQVGRSPLTAALVVQNGGARTRIDGEFAFARLDVDDLASDAQLARGRVEAAAIGHRLVPDTLVDLSHLDRVDGALRVSAGEVFNGGVPMDVRSLHTTLTLERRRLVVAPIRGRMAGGALAGSLIVDQRNGAAVPVARADLRLARADYVRLAHTDVTGVADVRVRAAGPGRTLRTAMAAASGRLAMVVRNGTLAKRLAYAGGFVPVEALTTGRSARATLRCAVVDLVLRQGRAAGALTIDTSESRLDGSGTVVFPAERLSFGVAGAAKHAALIRLGGRAEIAGTISDPAISVPAEVRSVGSVLKAIGRAVSDRQVPLARDADCGALADAALR